MDIKTDKRLEPAEAAFLSYQVVLSKLRREDLARGDFLLRKHLGQLQAWHNASLRAHEDSIAAKEHNAHLRSNSSTLR